MELIGTVATFVAVFSLLMAVFGPGLFPPTRLEAARAAALPRHRFERLVSAERPWWERLLGPLAGRIACWLDGNLIADFPNLRLRDDPSLKLNHAALDLHIGRNRIRENKKYYDDIILATSYIGPISWE